MTIEIMLSLHGWDVQIQVSLGPALCLLDVIQMFAQRVSASADTFLLKFHNTCDSEAPEFLEVRRLRQAVRQKKYLRACCTGRTGPEPNPAARGLEA